MVSEQEVEKTMKKALLKFSEQLKVPLKDFRINIRLDDEAQYKIAFCAAYSKLEPIRALSWGEIVGGGIKGMSLGGLVANSITNKLLKLSADNAIPKEYINVMIYPTNLEAKPELRLLDAEKIVKKIELKEII
jgi:hypothetical protein